MKNNEDLPLISIIIPAYNSENTIKRCIDSIVSQNYNNFEAIIIENNSKDNTLNVAKNLSENDNRIKVFSTKVKGVSNARNIGLDNAQGQIIVFCDSDDYLETDILNKAVSYLEDETIDGIIFGFNMLDDDENLIKENPISKERVISSEEFIEETILGKEVMGYLWNKIYRSSLIKGVRFNLELTHMEDSFFNIEVANKYSESKWKLVKEKGYNYVKGSSTATSNPDKVFDKSKNKYVNAISKIENTFNLTENQKEKLTIAKVKLSANGAWLASKDKNSEFYKDRVKESKKTFWGNYKKYMKYKDISLKEKIIMTLRNIIVRG